MSDPSGVVHRWAHCFRRLHLRLLTVLPYGQQGDKPPLPDAVVGMVMYGGRQAEGSEQGAGPREIARRAQRFQDRKRTALFYILDNR